MQFRVSSNAPVDTSYDPASGTPIRSGGQTIKRLVNTATGTPTLSSAYNLLVLALASTNSVTFSTPTPHITHHAVNERMADYNSYES
jgi:hypothetical protein